MHKNLNTAMNNIGQSTKCLLATNMERITRKNLGQRVEKSHTLDQTLLADAFTSPLTLLYWEHESGNKSHQSNLNDHQNSRKDSSCRSTAKTTQKTD